MKCKNNCGMTYIPAFYDFKCPKCGRPSEMTDKEKYDNQQICDITMDLTRVLNGKKDNEVS